MRKKIYAANWKMHMGPKEAQNFCAEFLTLVAPDPLKEWVIFPPSLVVPATVEALKESFIKVGVQNCHFEPKGAFTGEVSVAMAKEVGARYVLVGHSERRQIFGETDSVCAKKIKAVAEGGLIPMLCVGETQDERDKNQTQAVLKRQLSEGLGQWNHQWPLVIAYEPVWAIGTGKVATPSQAEEAHREIRHILEKLTGSSQRAAETQILYGGSVKPDNSRELGAFPNIDGFLIGGASLVAKSFAQIGQGPL